jgi:hypothetical protein
MTPATSLRPAVLALALLGAGCTDPLFFAQVSEERFCATLHGRDFPGAPFLNSFLDGGADGGLDGGLEALLDGGQLPGTLSGGTFTVGPEGLSLEVQAGFSLATVPQLAALSTDGGIRGLDGQLLMSSLTITATDGGPDLRVITRARLAVLDPANPADHQGTALLTLSPPPASGPGRLVLAGSSTDLFPHVSAGDLHLRLELAGSLPPAAWTADLEACFSFWVRVDGLVALDAYQQQP